MQANRLPKITVLMPVYNDEKYLAEAIKSVLEQSFADFEFIIINDGSTDESEKIVQKFQTKDARIVYLKNEKNLGIQKTLNKGLSFAKADYLARIDSDDSWCDKDKLQKQFAFLENNPDHALLGSALETIDENGKSLQFIHFKETDPAIRDVLLFSSQFAHPSVLIRAKVLDEVGYYSTEKKHKNVEDYELWLRLGTKYKFANLPDVTLKYRVRPNSLSMQNEFQHRLDWIKLTWEYRKFYPHFAKAFAIKIASLPVSRKMLDVLTKKSPLLRTFYAKLSGIKKN